MMHRDVLMNKTIYIAKGLKMHRIDVHTMLTALEVDTKGTKVDNTYFIGPAEVVDVNATPRAISTRATSEKRAIFFLLLTG